MRTTMSFVSICSNAHGLILMYVVELTLFLSFALSALPHFSNKLTADVLLLCSRYRRQLCT